jgi:threonine aldolase
VGTGIWHSFASDNYAPAHPEILEAITAVNAGHQTAYGDDDTTARLKALIQKEFGAQAEVFPVFNGTGANVTSLQAMMNSWEAVICAGTAHINADEGGAPEKVAGIKLWTVPTPDGKLTPDLVATQAFDFGSVHRAQPAVVSITQSTELGTIYTVEEVKRLADYVHSVGMKLHMDGARISNAAASLGVPFRAFTTDAGVDALSFGATKNGALGAEAVVALNPAALPGIPFVRKSAMQLASKMRFISVQLCALLENDLWLRNATHANAMAQRLRAGVSAIPGITVTQSTDANAVFAIVPPEVTVELQKRFKFYVWNNETGEVRWMCSWDTQESDVDAFVAEIAKAMSR